MKASQSFVLGLAAALLPASMIFANMNGPSVSASAADAAPVAVLASPETPQDQVWDMTYGAEKPVAVAQADSPIVDNLDVVDLSMG